jgi:hypothetical protein
VPQIDRSTLFHPDFKGILRLPEKQIKAGKNGEPSRVSGGVMADDLDEW